MAELIGPDGEIVTVSDGDVESMYSQGYFPAGAPAPYAGPGSPEYSYSAATAADESVDEPYALSTIPGAGMWGGYRPIGGDAGDRLPAQNVGAPVRSQPVAKGGPDLATPQGPPNPNGSTPALNRTAARPVAANGGGGYVGAAVQMPQFYYPADYGAQLDAQYSDAAIDGRYQERMRGIAAQILGGRMTTDDVVKQKQAADAARETERKEGAAKRAQYEAWQQSPLGMQQTMQRRAFDADQRQADYQMQQLAAGQKANEQMISLEKQRAERERKIEAEYTKRKADFEKKYNDELEAQKRAIESMNNEKVDPDRWWSSRSTGQKIFAVLGAMAAGWVQGTKGGPNVVLDQMQHAADQDIAAQKAEIENKRTQLGMRQTMLGRMREQMGDMDAAENAARAYAYRNMETQARQLAMQTQNEQGKIQLTAVADGLAARAAQFEDGMKLNAKLQAQAYMVGQAQLRAGNVQRQRSAEELAQYGYVMNPKDLERYVPGVGLALPGTDVKQMRADAAGYARDMRLMSQARAILAKAKGGAILSNTDKALLEQARSAFQAGKLNKLAGAAMSPEEIKRIMPSLGGDFSDYTDRNWVDMDRVLGSVQSGLRSDYNDTVAANIETPGVAHNDVDERTGRHVTRFKPKVSDPRKSPDDYAQINPGAATKGGADDSNYANEATDAPGEQAF